MSSVHNYKLDDLIIKTVVPSYCVMVTNTFFCIL